MFHPSIGCCQRIFWFAYNGRGVSKSYEYYRPHNSQPQNPTQKTQTHQIAAELIVTSSKRKILYPPYHNHKFTCLSSGSNQDKYNQKADATLNPQLLNNRPRRLIRLSARCYFVFQFFNFLIQTKWQISCANTFEFSSNILNNSNSFIICLDLLLFFSVVVQYSRSCIPSLLSLKENMSVFNGKKLFNRKVGK